MSEIKEPKRFWSKVDVGEVDECWEWLACLSGKGYGRFNVHSRIWFAHRVAWVLTYGPIPEGLFVCHHCDNPGCCNPYHLFLGTQSDNIRDAGRKGRMARKGEANPLSRLTKEEVLEIRKLYAAGELLQQELADRYGIDASSVSAIVRRETWDWLEEKEEEDGL